MSMKQQELNLDFLLKELDLPESAYERAKKRYEDLGEWFNRGNSSLRQNNVHIFPQGSFMLGTAIRPIEKDDEYDLDLACELTKRASKSSHSQKEIKELVHEELYAYRKARGIKETLDEKRRCWRLEYRDEINFHLDIVPAIPEEQTRKASLFESMNQSGMLDHVANKASESVVAITDTEHPSYNIISDQWNISNPRGYGIWFDEQMKTTQTRNLSEKAQVDELPMYKKKTPLQRCVQLLKRHRDVMYKKDEDSKPISIIVSTLAARAYNGETEIALALNNILETMPEKIDSRTPKVPNPVNPKEDFADKWDMDEYSNLKLEENFYVWLEQAKKDFHTIINSEDSALLNESFEKRFAVNAGEEQVRKSLGLSSQQQRPNPKEHHIQNPSKPWKL